VVTVVECVVLVSVRVVLVLDVLVVVVRVEVVRVVAVRVEVVVCVVRSLNAIMALAGSLPGPKIWLSKTCSRSAAASSSSMPAVSGKYSV